MFRTTAITEAPILTRNCPSKLTVDSRMFPTVTLLSNVSVGQKLSSRHIRSIRSSAGPILLSLCLLLFALGSTRANSNRRIIICFPDAGVPVGENSLFRSFARPGRQANRKLQSHRVGHNSGSIPVQCGRAVENQVRGAVASGSDCRCRER